MATADKEIVSYLPTDNVYATITYDTDTREMLTMNIHNGAASGVAFFYLWGVEGDPIDRIELTASPDSDASMPIPSGRYMGDDGWGQPSPDPDQGSNINYEAGWPL